jgi:hypothetical protein
MGLFEEKKMSNTSQLFVSSPYTSWEHHLDLSSAPETSRQLALALLDLRPITKDYPSQPYSESFNWQEAIDRLPSDFSGPTLFSPCADSKANSIVLLSIPHYIPTSILKDCIPSMPLHMQRQISQADS